MEFELKILASILKFAIENSLLLPSMRVKDLLDAHVKDVKDTHEMARVKSFEIQCKIFFMNSL